MAIKGSPNALGAALCEIVGLNPNAVRKLELHLEVGEIATMDVELYSPSSSEQADEMAAVVKKFILSAKEVTDGIKCNP